MSTPAPHVPVNFLLAGGGAFFSARCIALLAEYGYQPEEFGTYENTLSHLRQCRQEVADWRRAGSPAPGPDARTQELGRPVSDPNHYQSGHLGMNSCHQDTRGRPCTNFVDGHEMDQYPCMPHQGSALDAGSEHNRWTVREVDVPLSRGEPRSTYPASEMSQDANRRTEQLLKERQETLQAQGRGENLGRMALGTEAERQAALAEAQGAQGAGVDGEMLPEDQRIDGTSAADCINNFREGAVSGLRAHAADEETIARNDAAACGEYPDGSPLPGMPRRNAGETQEQYQQRLQDRVNEPGLTDDQRSARRGQVTRVQNARCRAEQGRRLQRDPDGRRDGRRPDTWDDLPRENNGDGARPSVDLG